MFDPVCDNLNLLWARLLIEECTRLNIQDVCIAPGSRSAPLTIACAHHAKLRCHTHFDERGLGYMALGMAKASDHPVLVICTSGTAVANLYPAFIEAAQTGVLLLIACADRPDELLNCGANQAISQPGIFAHYPVAEVALPAPDEHFPARALLGKLDDLVAQMRSQQGPALLNCPFREPFYPHSQAIDFSAYLADVEHWLSHDQPLNCFTPSLTGQVRTPSWPPAEQTKVLIILGAMDADQANAVLNWAKNTGWPIMADVQSQVAGSSRVISAVDLLLRHSKLASSQFDLIIQFGGRLVSKILGQWLNTQTGEYYQIEPRGKRLDPNWQTTHRFYADAKSWINAHPAPSYQLDDAMHWLQAQQQLPIPQGDDELAMVATLATLIPTQSALMLGNSLAIRHMQLVANHLPKALNIYTNRGCSGIDGLLASGCGIAQYAAVTTVLLGDTSLLHDLNSLALARTTRTTLIICVINNDGGGIFELLPVPTQNHLARDYYQLPHGIEFRAAAVQFGINYQRVINPSTLSTAYEQALQQGGTHLLEILSEPGAASKAIHRLGEQVRELSSL
ncbi:2-succinyl-5-enolpyruvyl-6-hydroxy-3-cyclohexene-1-carboxylic-acid synthase [Celerinatantimonas diazotrophica]|uniref:2-succinyl-5-enolpyruvyl-6-hydroxy-3-cyclohexene-1-carboxylate synthase n=1 Tax=Celerinatantimonas diazotrophica TaxID=412034 RepID=A0A4R1J7Y1_9GAMM|nr:2-succinyl-5-enolpyruvyl-6-hydroxy-3-cyclohexene-1-carboxylic-acid synthase [Celerinatantimonas diazotrophica]TCK46638.1 2-succinyl-5-enolpyruvyl-6-hydroxy-3-cyclohexene-1-carboxylate synthase [Celerinatantimonas diazotrophica]CAG9295340.1 2-succinyl-5-enolpyruvyl-6-hydroxy-3-cyclohexene-1-carboxylate synthase [Celerinatantimonas diazotrophica]